MNLLDSYLINAKIQGRLQGLTRAEETERLEGWSKCLQDKINLLTVFQASLNSKGQDLMDDMIQELKDELSQVNKA